MRKYWHRWLSIMLMAALWMLLTPATFAQAEERDIVVGDGNPASCTEAALDSAIGRGGILRFRCGPNPITIKLTTGKRLPTDIIIDGGGRVTLDGQNKVRHFFVNSTYRSQGIMATIRDINLVNGVAVGNDFGNGGCVYNRQSTLILIRVNLTNCFAETQGGGILNYKGNVTLYDVSIRDSRADDGGALAAPADAGTVHITKSRFTGNRSSLNGGALFIIGGVINVSESYFENNETTGNAQDIGIGGAIYTDKAITDAWIIRSRFVNNRAYEGGAVFADHGTILHLADCVFENNSARARGGAFGSYESDSYLDRLTFTNNRAPLGGAVHIGSQNNITAISRSFFSGNQSQRDGGAMVSNRGFLTISDSHFTNNSAGRDMKGDTRGGALVIYNGENTISNSTFDNNRVEGGMAYGGGVAALGQKVELINVTIANNTAGSGGGLYVNRGETWVRNSTIANNTAREKGRSFSRDSGTVRFKNTIIAPGAGSAKNCAYGSSVIDEGNNLQSGDTTCFPNKPSTEANLGALADHGGYTPTINLNDGSPAINSANADHCPATDQRGFTRVGRCDIGAFEAQAQPETSQPMQPRMWLPMIGGW